jgi:hypothetical protein
MLPRMSIRRIVPIERAEWQIAPPPPWVEVREPDWDFAPGDAEGVCLLLLDQQHDVATQSVSLRTVRRLLTHAAVQALGQVEIDFDPGAHRMTIHEVAVWRRGADGRWEMRSAARPEQFMLRQREQRLEQQMLDGRISVVALLEDVRVGDAIDLAWTLEPREPLPGLRFTQFFGFVFGAPVARASYSLLLDPASPVTWQVHVPPQVAEPVERVGGDRVTWTVERPPKFVPEPNASPGHWPFALLDVSAWRSWGEVAEFVAALWADALAEGADAIADEAARLRSEHSGKGLVRAAVRFVQEEVRYLAVDFGHGAGMLPNGAGTVLRRRFGDCKDKSVLLTALLRALGFEACPLLVAPSWRSAVARVQPSTAAFSHAIVTFVVDGRRTFVDPTFVGQGGDLAHLAPPPYGCGLEVRAGATGLIEMPAPPLAELSVRETFQLDRNHGRGSVEQVMFASGPLADDFRAVLVSQGHTAFFKARAETLQKHFPALALDEATPRVNDDFARNVIELRAQYALPTWGPAQEDPPEVFRYGAQGLALAIDQVDGPLERRQPWALRHPLRATHRVVVTGKCVQRGEPEKHEVSGPGFRYTCHVRPAHHAVTFDYDWQTTESEVPAAQWPAYRRDRERAFEHAGANVLTIAPQSAGLARSIGSVGERAGRRKRKPIMALVWVMLLLSWALIGRVFCADVERGYVTVHGVPANR